MRMKLLPLFNDAIQSAPQENSIVRNSTLKNPLTIQYFHVSSALLPGHIAAFVRIFGDFDSYHDMIYSDDDARV